MRKIQKLIILMLVFMCSPIMVFADASYPTLTQFKSRVSDSGSLKQYANTTQPVNYWYWVSTPGVSVMYNDKEDEYQYFDSKWRGLFLWKVGNGDYCTNDTLIKTNYTPQMLNDFQSPPTLYGLQADYVPAFMGGGKDPYYNGEGEKDNIYTLGTTAGSTLVTMYNDPEFKGAVGGHIDNVQSYISNNETWRLCDMFVGKSDAGDWNNYQPKQTPMIPTTVINGEVYYTGNIRFTKQQMDICKKYPNQCQTFTDVIVFYQYNPNAKLTEGGLPGGNNGNGDGDNEGGDEEPTETTTDAVLANPSRLDVGVEVKAKGAEANYKYMNGNVSGSITGAGGMQPGTNSHLVRRNKIELDIFVFNGESIKENLVLDAGSSEGGTPQKLKESEATLEMDTTFDGENNWMWRNRDNTYGFQLHGTAKVTWAVLNKYNGKEYAAVEDILTGAKTDSKGGTTSMTVTAKGFDDGKVLLSNVPPEVTAQVNSGFVNVPVKCSANFTDFEKDAKITTFKIISPSGGTVLDWSNGESYKLVTSKQISLSGTQESVYSFSSDIAFSIPGVYTYEATIEDLNSFTDAQLAQGSNEKLIRGKATARGNFEIKSCNPPVPSIQMENEVKVNENIVIYGEGTDGDDTDTTSDIKNYTWKVYDNEYKQVKLSDYFNEIRVPDKSVLKGDVLKNKNKNIELSYLNSSHLLNPDIRFMLQPKKEAIGKTFRVELTVEDNSPNVKVSTSKTFTVKSKPGEDTTDPDGENTTDPDGENTTEPDNESTTEPDKEDTTETTTENVPPPTPGDDPLTPRMYINNNNIKENRIFNAMIMYTNSFDNLKHSKIEWSLSDSSGNIVEIMDSKGNFISNGWFNQSSTDSYALKCEFQVPQYGDYTVQAVYDGQVFTKDVKIRKDEHPIFTSNLISIKIGDTPLESLQIPQDINTELTVEYKPSAESPDGDIVEGPINKYQFNTFKIDNDSIFIENKGEYYYAGLKWGINSDETKQAKIKFKQGEYTGYDINNSTAIEVFDTKTNTALLTESDADNDVTYHKRRKYIQQRESLTGNGGKINFIPRINLSYCSNKDPNYTYDVVDKIKYADLSSNTSIVPKTYTVISTQYNDVIKENTYKIVEGDKADTSGIEGTEYALRDVIDSKNNIKMKGLPVPSKYGQYYKYKYNGNVLFYTTINSSGIVEITNSIIPVNDDYFEDLDLPTVDDIGNVYLESDTKIENKIMLKCYVSDTTPNATILSKIKDEFTNTCEVNYNLFELTSLGGEFVKCDSNYVDSVEQVKDKDGTVIGERVKFKIPKSGIYKVSATVVDELGACSDIAEGYIRVYPLPVARLDTNKELMYNSSNKWNTKEILRFDITSGTSGATDNFGDMWYSMDFQKDHWTIEPLDGQGIEDILIMDIPSKHDESPEYEVGLRGYDNKLIGKTVVSTEPNLLLTDVFGSQIDQSDRDRGYYSIQWQRKRKSDGAIIDVKPIKSVLNITPTKITAENIPLGGVYRQFTFLKKGRYKITYSGEQIDGIPTVNTAEEIILVDEDLAPTINGMMPSLVYRLVTTDTDGKKSVTGADIELSGSTWNNILGFGRGACKLDSPDKDRIYKADIKALYDSENNDTYKYDLNVGGTLGPEYSGSTDVSGNIDISVNKKILKYDGENVKQVMVGDRFDNITEASKGFVTQLIPTTNFTESSRYITLGLNKTALGKYKYIIDVMEEPSRPVIKYVDYNKDKYYKRAKTEFICELDNIAPNATFEVKEKPMTDVLLINNTGKGSSIGANAFDSLGNTISSQLSSKVIPLIKSVKTNDIKATYTEPWEHFNHFNKGDRGANPVLGWLDLSLDPSFLVRELFGTVRSNVSYYNGVDGVSKGLTETIVGSYGVTFPFLVKHKKADGNITYGLGPYGGFTNAWCSDVTETIYYGNYTDEDKWKWQSTDGKEETEPSIYMNPAGLINSTSVVNYKNDTITLITKEKYDEWSKYIPYLSASMGISTYNFNLGGLSLQSYYNGKDIGRLDYSYEHLKDTSQANNVLNFYKDSSGNTRTYDLRTIGSGARKTECTSASSVFKIGAMNIQTRQGGYLSYYNPHLANFYLVDNGGYVTSDFMLLTSKQCIGAVDIAATIDNKSIKFSTTNTSYSFVSIDEALKDANNLQIEHSIIDTSWLDKYYKDIGEKDKFEVVEVEIIAGNGVDFNGNCVDDYGLKGKTAYAMMYKDEIDVVADGSNKNNVLTHTIQNPLVGEIYIQGERFKYWNSGIDFKNNLSIYVSELERLSNNVLHRRTISSNSIDSFYKYSIWQAGAVENDIVIETTTETTTVEESTLEISSEEISTEEIISESATENNAEPAVFSAQSINNNVQSYGLSANNRISTVNNEIVEDVTVIPGVYNFHLYDEDFVLVKYKDRDGMYKYTLMDVQLMRNSVRFKDKGFSDKQYWNDFWALLQQKWDTAFAYYVFKGTFSNTDNVYGTDSNGNEYFGDIYTETNGTNSEPQLRRPYLAVKNSDGQYTGTKIYTDLLNDSLTKFSKNEYQAVKDGYNNADSPYKKYRGMFNMYALDNGYFCSGGQDAKNNFKGYYYRSYNDKNREKIMNNGILLNQDTSFYMYCLGSYYDKIVNPNAFKYSETVANSSTYMNCYVNDYFAGHSLFPIEGEYSKYSEMLLKFDNGYFTVLGVHKIGEGMNGNLQNIKIQCVGNQIKVTRNKEVIFNVQDNDMLTGSRLWFGLNNQCNISGTHIGFLGVGSLGNIGASFGTSELKVTDGYIKSIDEVIQENNWRPGADKFVIVAQETDNPLDDTNTAQQDKLDAEAGILKSGVHFIGWNTEANKIWMNQIVSKVNGNNHTIGTIYSLNGEVNGSANNTIKFIDNYYSNNIKSRTWLLLNNSLIWETKYSDAEDDPELDSNTEYDGKPIDARRWRFTHYPEVLASNIPYNNSLGKFKDSGKWRTDPVDPFTQTGTYSVNFKVKDNPFAKSLTAEGTPNWKADFLFKEYRYFSKDYDPR